jgi:23S rRNA pseudouridine2605 synthase
MKKKTGFEKFHKVKSGSALKEQIRQEKKKITKERKEYFEAKRQEKYVQQSAGSNQQSGISSSASERKTTNYKLKTKNPGLQTAAAPQMPLNKYIAHSGVCSRRDAAELIKSGKVKLNGEVVTEPGRKVTEKDVVIVGNKKVYPVADLVYILLNKPKDYLTTTDDPQQRKTVLDLIVGATKDRVYPVGRLDRNTSGVLLLTNDGELAQKLTHPSNEIKKVYAVTLDKPLEKKHFDEILKGVALEDGMAHVDMLAYTDAQDKTQIGVEIHSGRNRIVRRIFEKFGYDVKGLDRVMFAGLTKKNVNRGRWRYLNEKEVRDLKYFKKGKG